MKRAIKSVFKLLGPLGGNTMRVRVGNVKFPNWCSERASLSVIRKSSVLLNRLLYNAFNKTQLHPRKGSKLHKSEHYQN